MKAPMETFPDDRLAEILQVSSEERGLWRLEQQYDFDRYTGKRCTFFHILPAENPLIPKTPGACVRGGFKVDMRDASVFTAVGLGRGKVMSRF